ncbi:MAG: MFS transporter [Gammaproteobacteria bacterium]|nr:MFS transporter [Gammaproteobacteria bacterium]
MEYIRAFRHRNFRLFFIGQGLSLIGTWAQQAAMSWLVYQMTNSIWLLGLTMFAGQIPILLFAPLAGAWSDHLSKRWLLLWSQVLAMLQAFALAGLVYSGLIKSWHLVVMATLLGIFTAFEIPTRQALMVQLVDDRKDLPNAIALNSFAVNSAKLIGPSVAGLLISLVGEQMCFLLNGVSYLVIIFTILAMSLRSEAQTRSVKHGGIREGLVYATTNRNIRSVLLLLSLVSLGVAPYIGLLPVYAQKTFHGDARVLGMLMSCAGLGALLGNIFLATRRHNQEFKRVTTLAGLCAGVGLMGFSYSTRLWLSMATLALVGCGIVVTAVSINTMLQTTVKSEFRGRIMSFYTMAYLGLAPVGSLMEGALANTIGTPTTLFIAGLVCVIGALVFRRVVYVRQDQA